MLAKKYRLNHKEFSLVHKSGRRIFKGSLLFYYLPAKAFKISIVVSKKISKKAVQRNKLRRQIYDYLQKKYLSLPHSIIIYPQKYEIDFSTLDQILSTLS